MQNYTYIYIRSTDALLIPSSRAYLIFNISFYPNVQVRHQIQIQIHILFFQLLTRSLLCLL